MGTALQATCDLEMKENLQLTWRLLSPGEGNKEKTSTGKKSQMANCSVYIFLLLGFILLMCIFTRKITHFLHVSSLMQ